MKTKTKFIVYILIAMGIVATLILCSYLCVAFTSKVEAMELNRLDKYNYTPIEYRADITKEPTMKEWVKMEVEKAGLSWEEVDCLIQHESGWNQWVYAINDEGTTDFGLWQWNSIHKDKVSVECRWDYKCATKKAIEKRIHDRNWHAWYGYLNYCR